MRKRHTKITRRQIGTIAVGLMSVIVAFGIGVNTSKDVTHETSEAADVTGSQHATIRGDVNGDGTVDIHDALMLQEFAMRLEDPTPDQRKAGDLNDNGDIDELDVLMLLKSLSRR